MKLLAVVTPPPDIYQVKYEMDSSSTKFRSFPNTPPYSNWEKFIMLPVFLWDDVLHRIYDTSGHNMSASEYLCDDYTNALENVFQIKCHVKKLSFI